MRDGTRGPTLIVDLGSIFELLGEWRARGDLRDARDIAQKLVEKPDRWILQLGQTGDDRFPNELRSHRNFPDRRVLVPRGWGDKWTTRDLRRRLGDSRSGRAPSRVVEMDPLDEFERLGFTVSESKANGGVHLASEIIGMAAGGGLPSALLLATSDPSVESILRTIRAAGVRTGLVYLGTEDESLALRQIADRFIDLKEVVIKASGLSLRGGFKVPEPAVEQLQQWIGSVLQGASDFFTFEHLLRDVNTDAAADAAAAGSTAIAELPRYPSGLESLLEEWFLDLAPLDGGDLDADDADAAEDGVDAHASDSRGTFLREWIQTPSGLVRVSLIKKLADEIYVKIAVPCSLPELGNWVRDRIREYEPNYSHQFRYLGHEKLLELLDLMDSYLRSSSSKWTGWNHRKENGTDYLVRHGQELELPSTVGAGQPQKIELVAQLVMKALVESGGVISVGDLALRVAADRDIGFSESNDWGGYKRFSLLLQKAEASSPRFDSQWEQVDTKLRLLGVTSAPGKEVRRFVPDFPGEDCVDLRLRAAVLATIIGPMPTVGVLIRRPNGLSIDARDCAAGLKVASSRSVFEFLLKSMRPEGGVKMLESVYLTGDYLLAHAGLPASTETQAEIDSTVCASQHLMERFGDSVSNFLKTQPDFEQQSESDRERVREIIRTTFSPGASILNLPSDEEVATKVAQSSAREKKATEIAKSTREMLCALKDDRKRFTTSNDSVEVSADYWTDTVASVQAYMQVHARSGCVTRLLEVHKYHEEWSDSRGEPKVAYASFVKAVAELARKEVIERFRIDWLTAPGWLPVQEFDAERLHAWRDAHHSIRRVTYGYLAQGIPISWIDVAAGLIRYSTELDGSDS